MRGVAEPDQGQPQQRRPREIEPRRPVLFGQFPHGRLGPVEVGKIDLTPRQVHLLGDDLHGLARFPLPETGAERGVPGKQRLPGRAQPGRVHRSVQIQDPMTNVDVGPFAVVNRVEEQSGLQGRQRPDFLNPRLVHH
ncbi:hypothetical protein GCM10017790_63770 [Amycolatopsis oliviviridis]|uniref:Uncharacterized protein n=1 Tax=Amycolatopsis oliviviridis TaxID=1471590 RepID=A0ABQ3M6C8_9PSEU|nr:hypothetical protein GCM10017790_63770 [Amycolatopsis oliviviridis]